MNIDLIKLRAELQRKIEAIDLILDGGEIPVPFVKPSQKVKKKGKRGTRQKWDEKILELLKSGPKTNKEIDEACNGMKQYPKLKKMVKAGSISKVKDKEKGVTYTLPKKG